MLHDGETISRYLLEDLGIYRQVLLFEVGSVDVNLRA